MDSFLMSYIKMLLVSCLLAIIPLHERAKILAFARVGQEICMGDLGCFRLTEDFSFPHGEAVLPERRENINTKFRFYTRRSRYNERFLVANDIYAITISKLNGSNPTVVIVHGFLYFPALDRWTYEMKDEFLKKGDYNVILAEWSAGSSLPYAQAVANTRVVGAEIALLISNLEEHVNIKPQNCHIIGFSLGAHAAGFAGERLKSLGRITGLDPAGPNFINTAPAARLDTTDAEFVDIIHTDASIGFGIGHPIGHLDLFPNGIKKQPGCLLLERIWKTFISMLNFSIRDFIKGVKILLSCEHQRAVELFSSSINTEQCKFVAFPCSDWDNFLAGHCTQCGAEGEDCAVMGLSADRYKPSSEKKGGVQLFLETGGSYPFCVYQYQVIIQLGNRKPNSVEGTIALMFKEYSIEKEIKKDYSAGEKVTFVFSNKVEILSRDIKFKWTSSYLLSWIISYKIDIESIKVVPMRIMKDSEMEASGMRYKPTGPGPFRENKVIKMKVNQ